MNNLLKKYRLRDPGFLTVIPLFPFYGATPVDLFFLGPGL